MWHWLSDNDGKLTTLLWRWNSHHSIWDKRCLFYLFFFLPGEVLHIFYLHVIVLLTACSRTDWHGAVQWDNSRKGFLASEWNASIYPVQNAMPWGLCVGESVCHRTNIEKVGRKGAPRWKGRDFILFSPLFSILLFLFVWAVFYLHKGQEITKCFFSLPFILL